MTHPTNTERGSVTAEQALDAVRVLANHLEQVGIHPTYLERLYGVRSYIERTASQPVRADEVSSRPHVVSIVTGAYEGDMGKVVGQARMAAEKWGDCYGARILLDLCDKIERGEKLQRIVALAAPPSPQAKGGEVVHGFCPVCDAPIEFYGATQEPTK